MEINEIFYIDKYTEAYDFAQENNLIIIEIEPDEKGRRFQIINIPQPTEKELTLIEISQLKTELKKAKEDVEQVELFGMQRDDFEQKKSRCAEIVLRLRELEKQI